MSDLTPEQRARADLLVDATVGGLKWDEANAYADAMLTTGYGRSVVLRYALADARATVRAALPRWLGGRP